MRRRSNLPEPGTIVCGEALSLIPTLADRSIGLVLTSPPYALKRKQQYGGVPEADYPAWMIAAQVGCGRFGALGDTVSRPGWRRF
jgi:DNA modification methylase